MNRSRISPAVYAVTTLLVMLTLALPSRVMAQSEPLTEENVINGTMNIDFKTRTNQDTSGDLKAGSPAIGAQDVYQFQMNVAKTTEYAGKIVRQPKLFSSVLGRVKQQGNMQFDINIAVLNPKDLKQKRNVGKWVGTLPTDPASGKYDLSGGKEQQSPLRIAIDQVGSAKAFTDPFGGKIQGKAEKKESLAGATYKRLIGDKTVTVTVKKIDPMTFENVELAKGPAESYPHTIVSGRLDYDYETGNWLTDGIHFKYNIDGKDYEDVVTGTIKWIEDPDRQTNGKGHYEFNLRFNEDKNKPAQTEAAAFDKMKDEDAFFAVDNSVPSMTGKIAYVDTFSSGTTTPISSKITYNLNANKLTKQQITNFFKMWMLVVGPTNDE
ncbi:MAG TPA: hypothetical protein VL282_18130 [Tepidisphaeraceae bacterium]|jgi:hypothetical protein|nr:hypothetical protein [Tepidisphaeraceae bacterium]